jgi:hypothetical protein
MKLLLVLVAFFSINAFAQERVYETNSTGGIEYSKGALEINKQTGAVTRIGPQGQKEYSKGGYQIQGNVLIPTNKTGGKEYSKGVSTKK